MSINKIEGIVTSGLGEGTFFMSMEHYKKEIKNRLGFDAYPGTLNLRIEEKMSFAKQNSFFQNPIKIDGFKADNKKFGGATCYKAKIKNINGAIIIPEINKYKNKGVIEFIANINLREKLKLKDGDIIKISLSQRE